MSVIHHLRLRFSNAYLVVGRRPIRADTGARGDMERIEAGLAARGIDVGDLALILQTHVHSDHVGTTAALARRARCPVSYHPADRSLADRGDNGPLRGIGLRGRLLARLFRHLPFEPVAADVAAAEGTRLDACGVAGTVLHTPGHTAGSIALSLDSGDAIAGDTLMGGCAGGPSSPRVPTSTPSPTTCRRRWGASTSSSQRPAEPSSSGMAGRCVERTWLDGERRTVLPKGLHAEERKRCRPPNLGPARRG
ncbi:MAG: MBL fold metallo-hydrolase [Planctomycetaceae bacterium]